MSEHVLVIDNYDSFTYNLVQYLGELVARVEVRRNDDVDAEQVASDRPLALVLSPGPKTPADAGACNALIERFGPSVPILGVCLGHECIAAVYGATIGPASRLMHGKVSRVSHDGDPLFKGLPNPFDATRYHSLAVLAETVRAPLRATAWAEDGTVMALRHEAYPVVGVQFHPESILTPEGRRLLANFLEDARNWPT